MNRITRTIAAGTVVAAGFTTFTACGNVRAPAQDIAAPAPAQVQPRTYQDDAIREYRFQHQGSHAPTSADAAERSATGRSVTSAKRPPDFRP
jgi:hypothetical protein